MYSISYKLSSWHKNNNELVHNNTGYFSLLIQNPCGFQPWKNTFSTSSFFFLNGKKPWLVSCFNSEIEGLKTLPITQERIACGRFHLIHLSASFQKTNLLEFNHRCSRQIQGFQFNNFLWVSMNKHQVQGRISSIVCRLSFYCKASPVN